jgi:hypothetical protein
MHKKLPAYKKGGSSALQSCLYFWWKPTRKEAGLYSSHSRKMAKKIIVLVLIFALFADTVVFAFNSGMGNFGKRQFDKVSK